MSNEIGKLPESRVRNECSQKNFYNYYHQLKYTLHFYKDVDADISQDPLRWIDRILEHWLALTQKR